MRNASTVIKTRIFGEGRCRNYENYEKCRREDEDSHKGRSRTYMLEEGRGPLQDRWHLVEDTSNTCNTIRSKKQISEADINIESYGVLDKMRRDNTTKKPAKINIER
jgi:hypothetical protein